MLWLTLPPVAMLAWSAFIGAPGGASRGTACRAHMLQVYPACRRWSMPLAGVSVVIFEEIIRSRSDRRALHSIAEGLWTLKK